MPRRNNDFQTIRSEGGLLPPDLLRRVIDPKANLDGTKPEDYGLPQGERLNEVITQSWNRLRKHWAEFRAAAASLPEGEPATGITNDKWSLPLLREFGFGPLPTTAGPEIGGRTYAINRFVGPVPIHLVGCGLSLDRRAAGVKGAAAVNPHGLVQEFLNRSEKHLWAIVSNGLRLRVLRDNQALSRQSFLEFDLEAMFAGEVFSDFVLLWLLAHASRFDPHESSRPETCWLEAWLKEAEEQGTRALTALRGGVEQALQILGQGLVSHPKNTDLREALRTGKISLKDFHGQLLRVVYRLIFLFVAEDRTLEGQSLLHPRDDSDAARLACERYAAHYSTNRLRELASRIKGSRHGDLWHQFQIIVGALSGDERFAATREALALPALGSMLWNPEFTALLNGPGLATPGEELTNYDFLEALRLLAFTRQGKVLRPVDYKNLGSEEFGGVYESFLALTPQISGDGARFTFAEFAGNERKTSGSYYTPDSLVQCLLDSALDPVVQERLAGKTGAEAEKALLAIKVCDKAVGSGHFLVGAAHRLARHLARVRALMVGESEPSPLLYQTALRDVIGHCLYGVDINPMAVELCKVTLWLEALEPGKPLSFLDHHIRCGNSLLGTTPELIAAGLPDDAFKPIEGDDPEACSRLKRLNRAEREGLSHLFIEEDNAIRERMQQAAAAIDELRDGQLDDIRRKEEAFRAAQSNYDFSKAWDLANLWCAAFVITKRFPTEISDLAASIAAPVESQGALFGGAEEIPKTKKRKANAACRPDSEIPIGITTQHLRDFVEAGGLSNGLLDEARRLADQYQFFHFHLAFPEVFAHGGFDLNLGNPPWEVLKAEGEAAESETHLRRAIARFTKASGRFPLSCHGKANTMPLFLELFWRTLQARGRGGLIVKTVIATERDYRVLFTALVESHCLVSLFDFENSLPFFEDVHRQERFCLITLSAAPIPDDARFGVCLHEIADLNNPSRIRVLSAEQLRALGGGVCCLPSADNDAGVAVLRVINNNTGRIFDPMWGGKFFKMLDTTQVANDPIAVEASEISELNHEKDALLPVYEGKFFDAFDHRAAGWDSAKVVAHSPNDKASADFRNITRFYLPARTVAEKLSKYNWDRKWILVYGRKVNRNNVRTMSATVLPLAGAVDTCPTILFSGGEIPCKALVGAALLNSFAFDYVIRTRLSGFTIGSNHLATMAVPVLPSVVGHQTAALIRSAVLELTYTAWDLESFAHDCGCSGPPFRWAEDRRFVLRCELDAAFFHLYLGSDDEWRRQPAALTSAFATPRDAVAYIMDTFPIVKRKDEAAHRTYRTKDTILEIYDALASAIKSGKSYQTRLDPMPASFRVAHAPRLPQDKRVALDSAEKFLVSFIYGFFHQTHEEATFDLLDSVFHLLRQRDKHTTEFTSALGDDTKMWLSSFNDKLPNKEFLTFLKRLEADGWITADRRTGHLSITDKFPAVPFDAWRNYDISAALRVIAQQPEVATLVLAQPDTPRSSKEFALQKAG